MNYLTKLYQSCCCLCRIYHKKQKTKDSSTYYSIYDKDGYLYGSISNTTILDEEDRNERTNLWDSSKYTNMGCHNSEDNHKYPYKVTKW